jgi:SAM-dependent methyltransferase
MLSSAARRLVSAFPIARRLYAWTPAVVRRFVAKNILRYRVVRTLDDVDVMMREVDAAAAISDDELRRVFSTFRMELTIPVGLDPASDEYRTKQLELYQWLHGRPYSVQNEVSSFDVAQAIAKPFPYSTKSADTVGNQLIAIGHIIKHLALKPDSRVLEFGPGWGNPTIALARMGHQVTAIEIEPNFVGLINELASRDGLKIDVIQGDFLDCKTLNGQFDAILFYECFHHCLDHRALVGLFDSIVAPTGVIMFAAEPIQEEFAMPWGLRLDGESLWAIRRNGWMELGFKESYFRKLMHDNGWNVRKAVVADAPWGILFIATRQ